MPRYKLKSVTEADRQYANLPEATRRLADRRIQELLDDIRFCRRNDWVLE